MSVGTQYTGTVNRNGRLRVFTWGWNPNLHVVWYIVPVSAHPGAPQLDWDVEVERANGSQVTYWVNVQNLTNQDVRFEMRYAILS